MYPCLSSLLLWTSLLIVSLLARAGSASPQVEAKKFLDEAKVHLSQARYHEALSAYESAIAIDPSNYMTYFRRAATYLNMGRTTPAIHDFSKVLELKPGFEQALLQRGRLYAKDCALENAYNDLSKYHDIRPNDEEIDKLIGDIVEVKRIIDTVDSLIAKKANDQAIDALNRIISLCPLHVQHRLKRAELHQLSGNNEMAIGDYRRIANIQPNSISILIKLASLQTKTGEISQALASIRECLKYDPDQKSCKSTYRELRRLDKGLTLADSLYSKSKWSDLKDELEGDRGLLTEVDVLGARNLQIKVFGMACKAYRELKDASKALVACNRLLQLDPENFEGLLNRAEVKILLEEYDQAMHDFQQANQINGQDRRAHDGYHRAQRLMRQASRKDYYKILGVPRTASKREIKKAFRKLAQEWHPDKYSGDLDKESVAKKMSEINEAYEILSDDELRQKFDNGEDPNVS
ncbi:uncharacterized protein BJ171DRAFT_418329, partial [Polychytrium aggregatum]|uniref:uncharacterized protein n=1 Tax=Polychytrium aggregatum TaxID=110093 RepID=UPI0022FE43D0